MDNQELRPTKRQLRAQKREQRLQVRAEETKRRKFKRVITWSVAVVLIVAAGFGVSQLGSRGPVSVDGGELPAADKVSERDQVKGSPGARVILVEYSDFQCPACATYYPMVKRLNQDFTEELQIAYRHFPLVSIHPNAELAARSAETAGLQDKFWEMHDLLFENQSDWSSGSAREKIFSYAESLGLDMAKFEQDIDSDPVKDKVNADYFSGQRAGVNSTPSFFLNGRNITNPRSYNDFAELIRQEINVQAQAEIMEPAPEEAEANPSDLEMNEEPSNAFDIEIGE